MIDRTLDRLALLLRSGAAPLLQRVPRSVTAAGVVEGLAARGLPSIEIVVDPWTPSADDRVRVLDARHGDPARFAAWDPHRAAIGEGLLVVLLDAASTRALLRGAPHLASWSGGVMLPVEPVVRIARTDEERAHGEAALRRRLAEEPELARDLEGRTVALDLQSGKLFVGRSDADPVRVAAESLDEGLVYVHRLGAQL